MNTVHSLTIGLWVVILFATWNMFQSSRPSANTLSWQSHVAIQMGLKEFVKNYIQEKLPSASDLQFTSLWSRNINDNNVKVFFEYQFQHPIEEQVTQSQLKGWALLNHLPQDPQNSWVIQNIQIDQQSVAYAPENIVIPLINTTILPQDYTLPIPTIPATNSVVSPTSSSTTTLSPTSTQAPSPTPAPTPTSIPLSDPTPHNSPTPESKSTAVLKAQIVIPNLPPIHIREK